MSIAIMQPYIFPYVGYFQLIYASDIFVFYDDVNFINRGWINRNRILIGGKDQMITIPCKDASQNKLIKDIELLNEIKTTQKILTTIQMAYRKAPFFSEAYPVIESVLSDNELNTISGAAINSIKGICDYIGLKKQFKTSSEEYTNQELKKADRLIDICHIEGTNKYINPSGGREIYTKEYYQERGVELNFLIPENYAYAQFNEPFVPWLSMIDVLMFNSKEEIKESILPSFHFE